MPTLQQTLQDAQHRLLNSASPRLDAEVLLCHVLGVTRSYCYTWPERELTAAQLSQFAALLARRETGEPVAYIVGEREFWSLPVQVSPAVLIPRSDSELLVSLALEKLPPTPSLVLDLGTGSGAIALALAYERRDCTVLAVDKSAAALQLARRNAQHLNLSNIEWQQAHWLRGLSCRAEIIVSNPPYIAASDPHLQQGDVRFEPVTALVAGQDGLDDIREIVADAPRCLASQGWLLLEHGWQQGEAVREVLQAGGFRAVQTWPDLAGQPRVSGGLIDMRGLASGGV